MPPKPARPPLLHEQCRQHLDAILGPHIGSLPSDSVIDVSYQTYLAPGAPAPEPNFVGRTTPIDTIDGIVKSVEEHHQRGDVYLGCGIIDAVKMASLNSRRGARASVTHLPATWIDLDVHDGTRPEIKHKASNTAGYPHPTLAEAYELVDLIGLTPTVVVRTAGGLHVHYALAELLDMRSESAAHLRRWRDAIVHAASGLMGRHIDSGVLADSARVLRPAGTTSWKYGTPYLMALETVTDARHSLDDIAAACTRLLDMPAKHTAHIQAERPRPASTYQPVAYGGLDALDDFGSRVSASDVLARASQFVLVAGQTGIGSESYWDPASAEVPGRRIHVHESGLVTCFGEATATVGLGLNFDGGTGGSGNAFSLFRHLFCHGDSRLACEAIKVAAGDLDAAIRLAATGNPAQTVAAAKLTDGRTRRVRFGGAR